MYPINSLSNMEYMLYGGNSGMNAKCPSYMNGYMANNGMWNYATPYGYNPYYNNYYNGQQQTQNTALTGAGQNTSLGGNQNMSFGSVNDWNTIGNYYLEGQNPSESLSSAAFGGAAFAIINNLRFIAHPYASLSSIGAVEKIFADVKKDGSALNKLWSNPETNGLMRDAYHKMHKLEGASKWRFAPLFKSKIDENTYKALKNEMEAALKSGDKKKIATITEKIRVATNAKTGWLPSAFRKIRGKEALNVSEKIADKVAIDTAVKTKLAEKAPQKFGEYVKHGFKSQGVKGGLLFGAMEFLMDFGKIKSAFSKDSTTGAKQLGQTSVKAAGSIVGWTVGEAAGAWLGAKAGAAIGTAVCPGLGTAIGAVAGLVGGSIGTWLMGKVTHKIIGQEAGDKVELDRMKKTTEGKIELLQLTLEQAKNDKKIDPKTEQALNNAVTAFQQIA